MSASRSADGLGSNYAPQALEALEQMVRFIAEDDPQAAIRFGDYLVDRAESLADLTVFERE